MRTILVVGATLALLGPTLAVKAESRAPLPPHFKLEEPVKTVLQGYPLGRIDEQAAFSHHGAAHRKLRLPNGKTGWVYNVGEKEWHRTYTLVFGSDGTVIDVLYYDHSRHADGITALQLQSKPMIVGGPRTGPGPAGQ